MCLMRACFSGCNAPPNKSIIHLLSVRARVAQWRRLLRKALGSNPIVSIFCIAFVCADQAYNAGRTSLVAPEIPPLASPSSVFFDNRSIQDLTGSIRRCSFLHSSAWSCNEARPRIAFVRIDANNIKTLVFDCGFGMPKSGHPASHQGPFEKAVKTQINGKYDGRACALQPMPLAQIITHTHTRYNLSIVEGRIDRVRTGTWISFFRTVRADPACLVRIS